MAEQISSTTNDELRDRIALTASPLNGGSVGVNAPYPARATFQVDDPSCRRIDTQTNSQQVNGIGGADLDDKWQSGGDHDTGKGSFYREGSRVYFDGSISLKTGEEWQARQSTDQNIFRLPSGYRPVVNSGFICRGRAIYDDGNGPLQPFAALFQVRVLTSGFFRIDYIIQREETDPGDDFFDGNASNGLRLHGPNTALNADVNATFLYLSGINFRCTGPADGYAQSSGYTGTSPNQEIRQFGDGPAGTPERDIEAPPTNQDDNRGLLS